LALICRLPLVLKLVFFVMNVHKYVWNVLRCRWKRQLLYSCKPTLPYSSSMASNSSSSSDDNASLFPIIPSQLQCTSSLVTSNDSSLETCTTVSKFQNSKISKSVDTNAGSPPLLSLFSNHNLVINSESTIESDCHLASSGIPKSEPDPSHALQRLFTSLSDHISTQTLQVQEQLQLNDIKMSQVQESFKIEVHQELDEFCALPAWQQQSFATSTPSVPAPLPVSVPNVAPVRSSSMTPSLTMSGNTPSMPADLESQMMIMLSESFNKLTTVLSDQKPDSKAEWHKFLGDSKKFRAWYLGVMAHISLPPWSDFYDPIRSDVVLTTSNNLLNGKLYSKVLLALDGTAYQNFCHQKASLRKWNQVAARTHPNVQVSQCS